MPNRIDTAAIATGQALPINKTRLDFLQDNINNTLDPLIKGLITYTPNDVIVIWGCIVTGASPTYAITAGAIYYNGLVYLVDANSISATAPQVPVWKIDIQYLDTGNLATFSNGTRSPVLETIKFKLSSGFSGSGIADYNGPTVKQFNLSRTDRQIDSASGLSTAVPTSGAISTISSLTTSAGINRDYKLEFSWSFNRISTSPEMYMGFYKVIGGTPTLLFEYHHVPIPTDGHSQVATIHWLEKNVPAGTNYLVRVRTSVNQYQLQSYCFTIDGQI